MYHEIVCLFLLFKEGIRRVFKLIDNNTINHQNKLSLPNSNVNITSCCKIIMIQLNCIVTMPSSVKLLLLKPEKRKLLLQLGCSEKL